MYVHVWKVGGNYLQKLFEVDSTRAIGIERSKDMLVKGSRLAFGK